MAVSAAPRQADEQQHAWLRFLAAAWSWLFLPAARDLLRDLGAAGLRRLVPAQRLQPAEHRHVRRRCRCCSGLGQTFVIIAGGIDLSVGFVMGLAAVIMARVMQTLTPADAGLALAAGLLAAFLVGAGPGRDQRHADLAPAGAGVHRHARHVRRRARRRLPRRQRHHRAGQQSAGCSRMGNAQAAGRAGAGGDHDRRWSWSCTGSLSQTRFGQYTYAIGGNRTAARPRRHQHPPPHAGALPDQRRLRRHRRHDLHRPLLGRRRPGRRAAAARFDRRRGDRRRLACSAARAPSSAR